MLGSVRPARGKRMEASSAGVGGTRVVIVVECCGVGMKADHGVGLLC